MAEAAVTMRGGTPGSGSRPGSMRRRNSVSRDKHFEHQAIFQIYDEDTDGSLSSDDTVKAMRAMGNMLTEKDAQEAILDLDLESEGVCDYERFLQLCEKYKKPPVKRSDIKKAFKYLDDDGNGVLDSKELKHVLSVLGEPLTEEELDDFFKHADSNKDGVIDYNEFADLMIKPTRRRMSLFASPQKPTEL